MFTYLALQWSPIQYYLYVGFAIYYWTNILKQVHETRRTLATIDTSGVKVALYVLVFVAALEIFVSHRGWKTTSRVWICTNPSTLTCFYFRYWALSTAQSTR